MGVRGEVPSAGAGYEGQTPLDLVVDGNGHFGLGRKMAGEGAEACRGGHVMGEERGVVAVVNGHGGVEWGRMGEAADFGGRWTEERERAFTLRILDITSSLLTTYAIEAVVYESLETP